MPSYCNILLLVVCNKIYLVIVIYLFMSFFNKIYRKNRTQTKKYIVVLLWCCLVLHDQIADTWSETLFLDAYLQPFFETDFYVKKTRTSVVLLKFLSSSCG